MKKDKYIVADVHNSIDRLITFQEVLINKLRCEVPPDMLILMQDVLSILKASKESCVQVCIDDDRKN